MNEDQDQVEEDKIDITDVNLNQSLTILEKGKLKEYALKLKKLLKYDIIMHLFLTFFIKKSHS